MKYLIMWSGGIDSTYTLAKMLKETDNEIHAHHIHINNAEGRMIAESEAIRALMPKLQAIRPFDACTSGSDFSHVAAMPYDNPIILFHAGVVARGLGMRAGTKAVDKWTIGTCLEEGHNQERWNVTIGAFHAGYYSQPELNRPPAPEFELLPLVSKREEMLYLDKLGLLDVCWYCRRPQMIDGELIECNQCKTCHEVKKELLPCRHN